jgi:probable phosphoglycerate mutase
MTTLLLVRHGLTAATGHVLSGRTPGVRLDERGRAQAASLAERIRRVPLAAIVSSPVERCAETAAAIAAGRGPGGGSLAVSLVDRLAEVDYGDWTGRDLRELAKEPLWRVVQATPSAAAFPSGETLRAMATRAIGRSTTGTRPWDRKRRGSRASRRPCEGDRRRRACSISTRSTDRGSVLAHGHPLRMASPRRRA